MQSSGFAKAPQPRVGEEPRVEGKTERGGEGRRRMRWQGCWDRRVIPCWEVLAVAARVGARRDIQQRQLRWTQPGVVVEAVVVVAVVAVAAMAVEDLGWMERM